MHSSQHFNSSITSYPIAVQINHRVYFEAKIGSNDTDITALLEKCSISPTTNRDHPSSYILIGNRLETKILIVFRTVAPFRETQVNLPYLPLRAPSCKSTYPQIHSFFYYQFYCLQVSFVFRCPVDSTTQFHNSKANHKVQFSFQAFAFSSQMNNVYIHCQLFMCHKSSTDSRCTSGCQGNNLYRLRRSLSNEKSLMAKNIERRAISNEIFPPSKTYNVNLGPVQLQQNTNGDSNGKKFF